MRKPEASAESAELSPPVIRRLVVLKGILFIVVTISVEAYHKTEERVATIRHMYSSNGRAILSMHDVHVVAPAASSGCRR